MRPSLPHSFGPLPWRSLALGSLAVSACVDPSARYREFAERAEDVGFRGDTPDGGGECAPPPPSAIDGPAAIAVETTLGPGMPIVYFGTIQTPEIDGKTHVVFDYRALDAADRRTPIGERLRDGPFPIEADGSFEASTPERELPGVSNPILPGVPITAQLTLRASICGVRRFYCGTVDGTVSSPVKGELAGRFGLELVEAPPARPRYGCGPDDIAAPLPE